MLLVIDAGNSRTKFGVLQNGQWLTRKAVALTEFDPARYLQPADGEPLKILISNVAGEAASAVLAERLAPWAGAIEWLKASPERCGVRNAYAQPEQLGADRWAMAIGAWHLYRSPCLVVAAGTATTLDVVSEGQFLGGCIMPGLQMMRESLARGAANLSVLEGAFAPLPRNSADAMLSGCLHAQLGAIEQMAKELRSTWAEGKVILTGGAAQTLLPLMQIECIFEPWLALEGLRVIGQVG